MQLPARLDWGHPQSVCQELVITSWLCNTARLSKRGAKLPQSSAPRQILLKIGTESELQASANSLIQTQTVVLHLLVAITRNKQCISVVLKGFEHLISTDLKSVEEDLRLFWEI